jgi:PilZ domain
MTDRRQRLRFEIVGRLRGTLVTEERLKVRDSSPGGVLVEAPWPLPVDSVHAVRIESDTHVASIEVRVKHVRPEVADERYLIGCEFLAQDRPLHEDGEQTSTRQASTDPTAHTISR